jgi:preprotein translocase subunit SecE
MFGKIKNFFIESRHELMQVQWPTRREAIYLTTMVIVISIVLAAFLGGLDYLLSYLLKVFVINA